MCRMCERYKAGESTRALARRYRVSRMTIAEHLRRYAVALRPRGHPRKAATS